jgi:hypothetical protein
MKISHEYVGHTLKSFEFKECKGCIQVREACGMITMNNHKICPCIKCLVKPTCKVHCPEFDRIFNISIGCEGLEYDNKSEKWNGDSLKGL